MTSSPPRKESTVLVADDEQYNIEFLLELFASLKLQADVAENVDAALDLLHAARYRLVVADLSIPHLSRENLPADKSPLFEKYPGLLIAEYARNNYHTGRQVVVYSVHDDPLVAEFAGRFGVTYLLKGRPRVIKSEVRNILQYDPLAKPKVP